MGPAKRSSTTSPAQSPFPTFKFWLKGRKPARAFLRFVKRKDFPNAKHFDEVKNYLTGLKAHDAAMNNAVSLWREWERDREGLPAELPTETVRTPQTITVAETISLQLARGWEHQQGGTDGIRFALGELTVEEIKDKVKLGGPQYLDSMLEGVAYMGKLSQEPLTDNLVEREAGRFLYAVMQESPGGLPGKNRDDLKRECVERFRIGPRPFDRIWHWAIHRTRAFDYTKGGPNGPMGSPRR